MHNVNISLDQISLLTNLQTHLYPKDCMEEPNLISAAGMAEPKPMSLTQDIMGFDIGVNDASSFQRFERREQLQRHKKK